MRRLRRLSGAELVRIFRGFAFVLKLRRTRKQRRTETLTIPAHPEIKLGTLHAVFAQAVRWISEADVSLYFYTD